MYKAILLVICGLIAVAPSPSISQEQPKQVQDRESENRKERDRLWAAANEARSEGNLAEAAKLGEQMFQIEKSSLGETDAELISSLHWLADVYRQQENWEKAISRQESAFEFASKIHGKNDWRTTDDWR